MTWNEFANMLAGLGLGMALGVFPSLANDYLVPEIPPSVELVLWRKWMLCVAAATLVAACAMRLYS